MWTIFLCFIFSPILFVLFILACFIVAWGTGARITVSRNGKIVGYVRWFKYYEVK